MSNDTQLLELKGISKSYGGTRALAGVDFRADAGSIHAILGENGAGKSTLMKILAGVVTPDTGLLQLADSDLQIASPIQAARHGIICVFQELSIIPHLSVADNICLADPPRNRLGLIDRRAQARKARAVLDRVGCGAGIDVHARCGDLALPQRQIVEIAKAVAREPRVLILDEATSALTASDVGPIMALLRHLRDEGVCVLFISHRMQEIEEIADICTVFRNGALVETFKAGSKTHAEIVQMMIGKPIAQVYPPKPVPRPLAAPQAELRDVTWKDRLSEVSLSVRPGEIVGLGGLEGQGQREVLLAISGVLKGVAGEMRIGGRPVRHSGPRAAKAARIALIPEDRKNEGLFLSMSVEENLGITVLETLSTATIVSKARVSSQAQRLVERLQIKTQALGSAVGTLSGGNQQKVVLAKWLATDPKLLLLMDPTRGIDVGTKQEIYRLFRRLADDGMAILFYSTDYDEIIGLCDRALIMYGGRIRAELSGPALTEHNILLSAFNLPAEASKREATPEDLAGQVNLIGQIS